MQDDQNQTPGVSTPTPGADQGGMPTTPPAGGSMPGATPEPTSTPPAGGMGGDMPMPSGDQGGAMPTPPAGGSTPPATGGMPGDQSGSTGGTGTGM
jgi:hypothetical protein